nr:hypothetical protein [uncultured Roseateles sp.]
MSLRPDKSGVIVEVADEQRLQLTQVVVDPQRIDAWRQPGIARLLGVIAVLGRPMVIMTSEQRVLYSNTPVVIPDEKLSMSTAVDLDAAPEPEVPKEEVNDD